MSLVGSLEDLGLGDILQIVSLSRKSGLLLLRSDEGDGRIVFSDGLVRAAYMKDEPQDLRGLLVPGGFVDPNEFERAIETAEQTGLPLDEVVAQRTGLAVERLDSLRREHVERVVLRMFAWCVGEFSFDVRDGIEERDVALALPTGINAQYLMMEATRLGDESRGGGGGGRDGPEDSAVQADPADDGLVLSGEDSAEQRPVALPGGIPKPAEAPPMFEAEPEAEPEPAFEAAPAFEAEPEPVLEPEPDFEPEPEPEAGPQKLHEILALSAAALADAKPEMEPAEAVVAEALAEAEQAEPVPEVLASQVASAEDAGGLTPEAPGPAPAVSSSSPPAARAEPSARSQTASGSVPLVVIDPELRALEWTKSVLAGMFSRIHIFQRCEGGIGRIRQYLSRAKVPAVLVSSRVPADPLEPVADLTELVHRLRVQAPRMPVIVMNESQAPVPAGADQADAVVTRPTISMLVDRRSQADVARQAEQLRETLERWRMPPPQGAHATPSRAAARRRSSPGPELERLRQISARLRDPTTRGDVLNLVLEFAAESFRRVAMFMVREDIAVGIAQRGLPAAGGPNDEEFRELTVSLDEPAWFRAAIENGEAHTAPPQDAGDRRLWELLGNSEPGEAHLAPIHSGGHVAALLYADNLPEGAPIGETTVLSIVLHEAGLALDRALLERALAEAESAG